jgi:vacuolar-type H+-ATPase catalytic subunit A/Vma1
MFLIVMMVIAVGVVYTVCRLNNVPVAARDPSMHTTHQHADMTFENQMTSFHMLTAGSQRWA